LIVAGVMSGTSADGINVALVRIEDQDPDRGSVKVGGQECPRHTSPAHTRLKLLGHAEYPYPKKVRAAVLEAMNSSRASVADLARLNFLLGELYADAVLSAQKKLRLKAELVGCHGQTLYHQGTPAGFLGKKLAVTWQTGEASVIAARVGVPVVSDFRTADMTAGGKGAPLVPYLDHLIYRDLRVGRIAQNIGGIANLTAIPAGGAPGDVIAFDTGPGNMVIDALTEELFGKPFDRNGKIAGTGRVLEGVVERFLHESFFRQRSPKTAGREEFGREFATTFLQTCGYPHPLKTAKGGAAMLGSKSGKPGTARVRKEDVIATATALTVRSISDAVRRFVLPRGSFSEMVVSGGGAKNPMLMAWLANELCELGVRLRYSDEFGIPSEAKEAVAFAVLAFETWNRRPSNVPSATGAKRATVLGKLSFP
jgi:anhydro-N-acetylmuramic acid kinase